MQCLALNCGPGFRCGRCGVAGVICNAVTNGARRLRNRVRQSAVSGSLWGVLSGGTGVVPVVNRLSAASVAVLPDGGNNSAVGKGWTSTGLAHDGGTLWWGNIAIELPGEPSGQRQIIQTNLAGTSILGAVEVTSEPQGVAVWGSDLYYATVATSRVTRIAKTGGAETVIATVPSANGLATSGTNLFVSSGSLVVVLTMDGVEVDRFDVGVDVDHLHYDATNNWLWISSGTNGANGVLTIWSLPGRRRMNSYQLVDAKAIEGIVVVGSSLIVASDGYYHGVDITDPLDRFNEIQTYSTVPFVQGIWSGGLADYVVFNKGAGATSADLSQIQGNSAVGAARIGSLYIWTPSGSGDLAVSIADSGGNTQEVKSITSSITRFSVVRGTYTGPAESIQIRLRGGVTVSNALTVFIAGVQVEAGSAATDFQEVR